MEYLSIHDMSKNWNIKERKLTALCRDNRIAGAKKFGKEWMIPSDAIKPLDKRTKEFEDYKLKLEELKTTVPFSTSNSDEKVIKRFFEKYSEKPMYTAFTPYKICPLGAHVDHNLGLVTGFAIDKGIHIAYSYNDNGIIDIESLQYQKKCSWHVTNTPYKKQNDWADPLRGVTIELNNRYPLRNGISAIIDGELPIGGLSSSSSLIITFINALAFINNIKLDENEMIEISELSEKNYLGIENGKLNQMCEIYSKKNNLLFVDTKDDSYELIETPKNMKYVIGIFFSGIDKGIDSEEYNKRTDELRSTAYFIKALNKENYTRFNMTNMRDIPYETYIKYKSKLPINYQKRAEHFYSEIDRVKKGIAFYEKGDINSFGKLVTESGESSINNWETGSKEMIDLFNIIKSCDGVYGTRFSGSGFKGSCLAFINPKKIDDVIKEVEELYISKYPKLKEKYSAHICNTADGIKL